MLHLAMSFALAAAALAAQGSMGARAFFVITSLPLTGGASRPVQGPVSRPDPYEQDQQQL